MGNAAARLNAAVGSAVDRRGFLRAERLREPADEAALEVGFARDISANETTKPRSQTANWRGEAGGWAS